MDFTVTCLTSCLNGLGESTLLSIETTSRSSEDVKVSDRSLVNVGDGTLRFCNENHIKLSKISSILITSLSPSNIAGFPGIFLSLSDQGVGELTVIGPVGIRGYIELMTPFINRKYPCLTFIEIDSSETIKQVNIGQFTYSIRPLFASQAKDRVVAISAKIKPSVTVAKNSTNFQTASTIVLSIPYYFKVFPPVEEIIDLFQTDTEDHPLFLFIPLAVASFCDNSKIATISELKGLCDKYNTLGILYKGILSKRVSEFTHSQLILPVFNDLYTPLFPKSMINIDFDYSEELTKIRFDSSGTCLSLLEPFPLLRIIQKSQSSSSAEINLSLEHTKMSSTSNKNGQEWYLQLRPTITSDMKSGVLERLRLLEQVKTDLNNAFPFPNKQFLSFLPPPTSRSSTGPGEQQEVVGVKRSFLELLPPVARSNCVDEESEDIETMQFGKCSGSSIGSRVSADSNSFFKAGAASPFSNQMAAAIIRLNLQQRHKQTVVNSEETDLLVGKSSGENPYRSRTNSVSSSLSGSPMPLFRPPLSPMATSSQSLVNHRFSTDQHENSLLDTTSPATSTFGRRQVKSMAPLFRPPSARSGIQPLFLHLDSIKVPPPSPVLDIFDLTFLGTGCATPSKHRNSSCIMLCLHRNQEKSLARSQEKQVSFEQNPGLLKKDVPSLSLAIDTSFVLEDVNTVKEETKFEETSVGLAGKKRKKLSISITPSNNNTKPNMDFINTSWKSNSAIQEPPTAMPSPGTPEKKCIVLFDVGEGTAGQMFQSVGGDVERYDELLLGIKLIWISHHHADHITGFPQLLQEIQRAHLRKSTKSCDSSSVDSSEENSPMSSETSTRGESSSSPEKDRPSVKDPASFRAMRSKYDVKTQYSRVDCSSGKILVIAVESVLKYFEYAACIAGLEDLVGFLSITNTLYAGDTREVSAVTGGLIKCLRSVPVNHCFGAYGAVLDFHSTHKVVYSGDCRPSPSLVRAGLNCDLLIHEATFEDCRSGDALKKRHCTVGEAKSIAKQMKARNTVLTHFSQRYPFSGVTTRTDGSNIQLQQPQNIGDPALSVSYAYDFLHFSFPSQVGALPAVTQSLNWVLSELDFRRKQAREVPMNEMEGNKS